MPNPVVHFEIGVKDLDASSAFYRDLFGWEIRGTDPGYALIDSADGGIGGGLMGTREGMAPYVTVYVAVEDLAAGLQRAVELGGEVLVKPTPIPGVGAFALFRDLDANVIGLLQPQ